MTRTERRYYILEAAYCCCWAVITPAYPLFLLSRGLNILQCHLVLATFFIGMFVFEVPTGAIADLLGRRISFVLSCLLRGAAFVLYAFADGFADCLIAETIDALGQTLASGALDAWAVDGLRHEGNTASADRFFARSQMIARSMMIIAGIGGGYVAQYSWSMAWFAGTFGFVLTAICGARLMHDVPRADGAEVGERSAAAVGRTSLQALKTVWRTPVLRLICLVTVVGAFGMMPSHMLWQPRVHELTGAGPWLMGWVWAMWSLAIILSSWILTVVLHRWQRERLLVFSVVWRSAMFATVAMATTATPAISALVLGEMETGFNWPLLQGWMNDHIPADRRATLLSVRAMAFTFGGAAGLALVGLIALQFGMVAAWTTCAVMVTLQVPLLLRLGRAALALRDGGTVPDV